MNTWSLAIELDREGTKPLYLQIAEAITEDIRRGRFKPGEHLPGTRQLALTLQISRNTALAVYRELVAQGWLEALPDEGTRVAEKLPLELNEPSLTAIDSGSWKAPTPLTEAFFQPQAVDRDGFRLIPDLPDVRLVPTDALHRAYGRVLRLQQQNLLQPNWDPRGHLGLRTSLAQMLRELRGLAVEPGNLVLTRGLMGTLHLVARTLFEPGDAVAVENPGHFRVAEAFRAAGARLIAIPSDGDGLDVDALERILSKERVKLLALSVSPHYPTHAIMSSDRRQRLLEIASKHGVRILEADHALGFHQEFEPTRPLASQDSDGQVLFYASLEQILAPGMQVGFVAGDSETTKRLGKTRQLIDWPGNLPQEATLEELFRDGEISRHLRRIRKIVDERRETMIDRLMLHLGRAIDVVDPREGLSLWVRVAPGISVETWIEHCAELGVVFYPGHLYELNRRPLPYVCMGFAPHDLDEQNEACERMAQAMKKTLAVGR
jgi:GntR family transcriptional regulator / MocR family aminotransferase